LGRIITKAVYIKTEVSGVRKLTFDSKAYIFSRPSDCIGEVISILIWEYANSRISTSIDDPG